MNPVLLDFGLVLLAYLAGSFPTGVLVARARGVDLRAAGSGNIGATNVARTLGKGLGAFVLLVDAAKGYGPTLLAATLERSPWLVAGVALAAVLGHVFPVWSRLRGGKGVATAAGAFLALAPAATGIAAGVWALTVVLTRISSVGSLLATATLPAMVYVLEGPLPTFALSLLVFAFILFTHRSNIARLLRRDEHRV